MVNFVVSIKLKTNLRSARTRDFADRLSASVDILEFFFCQDGFLQNERVVTYKAACCLVEETRLALDGGKSTCCVFVAWMGRCLELRHKLSRLLITCCGAVNWRLMVKYQLVILSGFLTCNLIGSECSLILHHWSRFACFDVVHD